MPMNSVDLLHDKLFVKGCFDDDEYDLDHLAIKK